MVTKMTDLIDADDIINFLKANRMMRDEIYRRSDKEGFNFDNIQDETHKTALHKKLLKSA